MPRVTWWIFAVAVVGCTKPNPLDCSDGLCSEADHPFCDVDGTFGGTANTCVAVTCTPKEPATCRGDVSVVCNDAGNNYDLVSCERGCDPTYGCRQCTTNDECANPSPICDGQSSACRACKVDDECASKVCAEGACLAEAGILYAAPTGAESGPCSLAQPCSLQRVQSVALSNAVPPLIRILPGVYAGSINVHTATTAPIRYVASGANLVSDTPIAIGDGATVEIRGITAAGASFTVNCDSTTQSWSNVLIADSKLVFGSDTGTLVTVGKCDATFERTDLEANDNSGVTLGANSAFVANRSRFHSSGQFGIGSFGSKISVRITNSVLEHVFFLWNAGGVNPGDSTVTLAFNTILLDGVGLDCSMNSTSQYRTSLYENNIVVATNVNSSVTGSTCTLSHNILFPFTGTVGTNVVADPQFLNAAARDYHLSGTSPGIDAAVPVSAVLGADFDGTARPQGAAADIGAFERVP